MATNINGDTGVDKIQAGAVEAGDLADASVTDAKIDTMSSSKLTGALPAIDGSALTGIDTGASTTYGDVGTYVVALYSGTLVPGNTTAGSNLHRNTTATYGGLNTNQYYVKGVESTANSANTTSLSLSGTWRSMCYSGNVGAAWSLNLFVRTV